MIGSIGQEFVRGVMVRRRQTGSDPFTSLIGLVLSKRRKYGGYIVHLGVAVMFIGFGGKAYDRMVDRTIEKPAITDTAVSFGPNGTAANLPPNTRSAFAFGDYTFLYERLIHTSDDHKDAVTAQVSIWHDGENIGVVYPAKWDYHKGEEATTEVAIRVRLNEDVYVVLTGYDLESQLANFRVFINPLISWVWIGFLLLALGTLICLIPQSVVDRVRPWRAQVTARARRRRRHPGRADRRAARRAREPGARAGRRARQGRRRAWATTARAGPRRTAPTTRPPRRR